MTPGTVLARKYRLVSQLGEGGMGVVWRAEDLRLSGASVAIKLMHSREAADPDTRARFEAEARTAAKLRGNPHIVQVLDVGVDGEGNAPFIAMELLEGETLRDRLLRTRTLSPTELARIVCDVVRGLTRAHELGVIHRDLKPANIFLVRSHDSELAKVLDFGIAKRPAASWHHAPTATGALLGTPIYMSPEQIMSSKSVDQHADLWSLAVIAVECLTGKLPFESDNLPGLALQICQGRATVPSRLGVVPPGFDQWFQRATQLDPELRFRTAAQMAEALRRLCGAADEETTEHPGLPSLGPLSLSSATTRRRWQRGRWGAALGLSLAAACTLWLLRRPAPSVATAPVAAAAAALVAEPSLPVPSTAAAKPPSAAPQPAASPTASVPAPPRATRKVPPKQKRPAPPRPPAPSAAPATKAPPSTRESRPPPGLEP